MSGAIYNEIDPFKAAWLRELIKVGAIADGTVETRSIVDVKATDVRGTGQRHFFAGVGAWSYALRLAGLPDDLDLHTGSCPCQPFSSAGTRSGVLDARHLWPAWAELVAECRPPVVFGEQVASRDGLAWLDLVRADLERCGYAFGASDLCAAGVGAPHIRQRLYFVGVADGAREYLRERLGGWLEDRRRGAAGGLAYGRRDGREERGAALDDDGDHARGLVAPRRGADDGMADAALGRREARRGRRSRGDRRIGSALHGADGDTVAGVGLADTDERGRCEERGDLRQGQPVAGRRRSTDGERMGDPQGERRHRRATAGSSRRETEARGTAEARRPSGLGEPERSGGDTVGMGNAGGDGDRQLARELPSDEGEHDQRTTHRHHAPLVAGPALPGPWSDVEWILCTDGKARPAQPGSFPLAHGAPARVGRLRGYGDAIVAEVAALFIGTALEAVIA